MGATMATWLLAALAAVMLVLGSIPAAAFVAFAAILVGLTAPNPRRDAWRRNHGGAYRRRRP